MIECLNKILIILQLLKELISFPISFSDILSNDKLSKEIIIYFMITFIWVCFLCWILYKGFIMAKGIFNRYFMKRRLSFLSCTTGGEVAVLKYILDNPHGDVTWLPFDNASVLSLSKKGFLESAGILPAIRRSWRNMETMCYPYSIPIYLRKYIKSHNAKFENAWGNVPRYTELNSYQNSLSDEPPVVCRF